MAGRGMITEEIKAKSKELLGYEITQRQLRFMPYLSHALQNSGLDPNRVSQEERGFLKKWKEEGRLEQNSGLQCDHAFWIAMQELIYMGYVDNENR